MFKVGEIILSGFINISGLLTIKVNKSFKESAVSKILDLVQNAATKKAKAEKFVTKFAKYYTPTVVNYCFSDSCITSNCKRWRFFNLGI
jgi:Cd2+/Zn2+-exporting ATPase